MFKVPQQLIPLFILFSLAIAALIVAREMLVPESFGDLGHYRANALAEVASQKLSYVSAQACAECHDDIYAEKTDSHHSGVACEACHGPGAEHIEEPDENVLFAPRERGYCVLCHGYNPSRPSGFPQIIAEQHNPGKVCMSCHDPHNPVLPHTPEECSACHREIANVKLVSHHTNLPCVQCHDAPEGHRLNPRQVRAEKPTRRKLCGGCHAEDAESPEYISEDIPRIEMETHGDNYMCWDCHYPHHPEGK